MTDHPLHPQPYPAEERERIQEIARLKLGSKEADAILDELCKETAEAMGLPIGVVSIVLDGAQFFPAHHGLDGWIAEASGTPVEWAFCRFAVAEKSEFMVEDATEHELVKDNPLVTEVGIRCYLGAPLMSSNGHALGTLCVIGTEARTFSDEERERVHEAARRAVERLEARVS